MGFSPLKHATTAVALQVGCSYIHLHLDSRAKELATYWTEIASKPSNPRNLRHLKLTLAQGYRLKVCTLALYTVCNSYDSSSRGNRTAPRLVPKPLQRRTVQPTSAYHSRPTVRDWSLSPPKTICINEPFRLWLLCLRRLPHSDAICNGELARRSVFILSRQMTYAL